MFIGHLFPNDKAKIFWPIVGQKNPFYTTS